MDVDCFAEFRLVWLIRVISVNRMVERISVIHLTIMHSVLRLKYFGIAQLLIFLYFYLDIVNVCCGDKIITKCHHIRFLPEEDLNIHINITLL